MKNAGCIILLKPIISGIQQGSIIGHILFNIFINDMFLLSESDLHNFADDNTVTAIEQTIQELKSELKGKAERAIE